MKIEGVIHISGMNEVLFRQKYRGKFYVIVQYLKATQGKWVRVIGEEADGFYRNEEDIMHSIKSLALNPSVKLSFNDGIMFVDFLHESISQREWVRLEKYTDAKHDEFVKTIMEMIR